MILRKILLFLIYTVFSFSIFAVDYLPNFKPAVYSHDIKLNFQSNDLLEYRFKESLHDSWQRFSEPLLLTAIEGLAFTYTVQIRRASEAKLLAELQYTVDKSKPFPVSASHASDIYYSDINLSFSSEEKNIYYAINGGAFQRLTNTGLALKGDRKSLQYYTVDVYSLNEAGRRSSVSRYEYTLDTRFQEHNLRVYSPASGDFLNKQFLYIDTENFQKIRYTVDGTDPSRFGQAYTHPVLIDRSGRVQLRVVAEHKSGQLHRKDINFTVMNREAIFPFESGLYDSLLEIPANPAVVYSFRDAPMLNISGILDENVILTPLPAAVRHFAIRARTTAQRRSAYEYRYFYILDDTVPAVPTMTSSSWLSDISHLVLSTEKNQTIFYTLDGSDPRTNGVLYSDEAIPALQTESSALRLRAVSLAQNGRFSDELVQRLSLQSRKPDIPQVRLEQVNTMLKISIQARPDEQVFYSQNKNFLQYKQNRADSEIFYQAPKGLEQSFVLYFQVYDRYGNGSEIVPIDITVDNKVPDTPRVLSLSDSRAGFRIEGKGRLFYRLSQQPFSGYIQDLYVPYEAPVNFSIEVGVKNIFYVQAMSVLGNSNYVYSDVQEFVVDNRKPFVPPLMGIENHAVYSSLEKLFQFYSYPSDIELHYTITDDQSEPLPPTLLDPKLANGIYLRGEPGQITEYRIKVLPYLNSNGKMGEVQEFSVTLDNSFAPAVSIAGVDPAAVYSGAVELVLQSEADEIYYALLPSENLDPPYSSLNGEAFEKYYGPLQVNSPDGRRTSFVLHVFSEDSLGNRSRLQAPLEFTIDRRLVPAPVVRGLPHTGLSTQAVTLFVEAEGFNTYYTVAHDGSMPRIPSPSDRLAQAEMTFSGNSGTLSHFSLCFVSMNDAGAISEPVYASFSLDRREAEPGFSPELLYNPQLQNYRLSWNHCRDCHLYYRVNEETDFHRYTEPVFVLQDDEQDTKIEFHAKDLSGNVIFTDTYVLKQPESDIRFYTASTEETIVNSSLVLSPQIDSASVYYELRSSESTVQHTILKQPFNRDLVLDVPKGAKDTFSLTFYLYDSLGRWTGVSEDFSVTINKELPQMPSVANINADTVYADDRVLSFEKKHDVSVYFRYSTEKLENQEFQLYTEPLLLSVEASKYEEFHIEAYAVNNVGNKSAETLQLSFVIDKARVYVSPKGSDLYEGSFDRPFATLEKALDTSIREARPFILLAEGEYNVYESILFSENVSLIGGLDEETWKAANGVSVFSPSWDYKNRQKALVNIFADVEISHVVFRSALVDAYPLYLGSGSLLYRDTDIIFNARDRQPYIYQDDGQLNLSQMTMTADRDYDSPMLVSTNASMNIDNTTLKNASGTGHPLLRAESMHMLAIQDSLFISELGGSQVLLDTAYSEVKIRNSQFTVSNARSSATLIQSRFDNISLTDSLLMADNSNRNVTLLQGHMSSVSGHTVDFVSASAFSSVALSFRDSAVILEECRFRMTEAAQFLYAVNAQGTSLDFSGLDVVLTGSLDQSFLNMRHGTLFIEKSRVQAMDSAGHARLFVIDSAAQLTIENNEFRGSALHELSFLQINSIEALELKENTFMDPFTSYLSIGNYRVRTISELNRFDGQVVGGPIQDNR